MLSVALTGNVASGKSEVTRRFARWGAVVIDSDLIVRELQAPGSPVLDAIIDRFGPGIVDDDGCLDRAALRRRILADPGERADLNRIVHPAVRERQQELAARAAQDGARIVVHDIPLLFEAADPAAFDRVVLVDAPEALRRERLVRRRGLPLEEAEALLAAQLPADQKRSRSDFVIENDGTLDDLDQRARAVWDALEAEASSPA